MNVTKTITRKTPDHDLLEITLTERDGSDGLAPGFSVTGSLWEHRGSVHGATRKALDLEPDAFGMLHETILEVAPELKPVIDLHLADPAGVPMHALANGWYFYSGKAAAYEREQIAAGRDYGYSRLLEKSDHARAAEALRVDPNELPRDLDEEGFTTFVESLKDRYLADAARARAVIASIQA